MAKHQYAVVMTGTIDRGRGDHVCPAAAALVGREKAAIVQATDAVGMSVSLIAQQHSVAPNQVFKWRQLYADGVLSTVGAQRRW